MTSKPNKPSNPFAGKTRDEIFGLYGGEMVRGAVSSAIRDMYRAGYSKSQIAKALNKRYQHVRNVLTEDAKRQK